ncbi:MAG: hypothetical protein JWL92_50 [Candidatus Nomurabacteria bacterium]|nr:hypothetical protein [Candidatus Nomurabacteria bacterium]
MEHLPSQNPLPEETSPLSVVFRAPEALTIDAAVKYNDKEYVIKEIYPDMKDGKEVLMYKIEDTDGNPLEKDGIMVYVPAEDLEAI